jgi:hypothetical protein
MSELVVAEGTTEWRRLEALVFDSLFVVDLRFPSA